MHLINNMSMLLGAASNQDHNKPLLQYQYTNVNAVHPMNLATTTSAGPSVVQATTTIDPVALVYQHQQHQQQEILLQQQQQFQQQHQPQQQAQPISYKIPQLNAVSAVVNQIQQTQQPQQHQQTTASSSSSHNLIQKKKDIVAEAIRAADSATEIKKEPVSSTSTSSASATTSNSTSTNSSSTPVAIKSEPSTSGTSSNTASNANKPASNSTTPTVNRPGPKPGTSTRGRGSSNYGRGGAGARTQIMPRLQLLDDEDDGVTCRMCLQPFWYKSQLHDHLKTTHSISDPERYEKEEREKKLRRLREEQHRMALSQRGRGGGVMIRGRGGQMIRGRGGVMISRGGIKRPLHTGPRPSFQYRDGSFICDLCKKSFSDGNDMVTHWKSHVKQQRANMAAHGGSGGLSRGRGRPPSGAPPGRGRGRGAGRPPGRPGRGAGRPAGGGSKREKKQERKDKGKPRWTAYLLWSTRRRKELTAENESYTFAQIGRIISDEWKKVEGDDLDKLKEEAEKLNFEGVKKLPKAAQSGSSDSEEWSEDEDPSFDETHVKKPIMLKIKREKEERNTRQRKRPSFFQDYENEENNLDKILDEFEQEQILEARAPREPKPKREPKASSRPRKRRAPSPTMMDDEKEIELETSRSGRVRKIRRRKVYAFDDPDEPDEDSGDDGDEFQPDSEPEEPDEEYIDERGNSDAAGSGDEGGPSLPFKKRKGEAMTKDEIEQAKRAAFAAKPQIVMDSKKFKGKDRRDEIDRIIAPGEEDNLDFSDDELSQVLKMQVKKEPAEDTVKPNSDETEATSGDLNVPEDVSLNTPKSNPPEDDADDEDVKNEIKNNDPTSTTSAEPTEADSSNVDTGVAKEEGGDLEGSVTEEAPPDDPFDSDNDVVDDEPADQENASEPAAADHSVNSPSAPSSQPPVFDEASEAMETTQDTTNSATNFSDETAVRTDSSQNVVENGQNSLDSSAQPPKNDTIAEDDILTSTQATDMEEGDEQYKNLIAESQMDNIFN